MGLSMRDGIRLAAREINAAGGVLGRQIELVERDDEARPQRGAQVVQDLINRERIHAAPGERGTEERRETARRHKRHPAPSSRPESPEPAYAAGVAAARGLSARVPTPAT